MTYKELNYLLHDIYPHFEVLDYRPFPPIDNAIIVWQETTNKECLFIAWVFNDAITRNNGISSRLFNVFGHLFTTNQQLWENYMDMQMHINSLNSIDEQNNKIIKEV